MTAWGAAKVSRKGNRTPFKPDPGTFFFCLMSGINGESFTLGRDDNNREGSRGQRQRLHQNGPVLAIAFHTDCPLRGVLNQIQALKSNPLRLTGSDLTRARTVCARCLQDSPRLTCPAESVEEEQDDDPDGHATLPVHSCHLG